MLSALVVAFAGCGSDDEPADSSSATGATGAGGVPLSEEEFVSRADAICAETLDQLRGLGEPTTAAAGRRFAEDGIGILESALPRFQALTPPADMQADWDGYVARIEGQISEGNALLDALEAGDQAQVQVHGTKAERLDEQSDRIASDLGLADCAGDPNG